MNIANIRTEYKMKTLSETDVEKNPSAQFEKWWKEAENCEIHEVNAMTLSTVRPDGMPEARIVLLKGFDSNGLVFFTNYNSHKGDEISANNKVCLTFFWKELERQVRINGVAEKIPAEHSDAYFQSRPEGSKIGAWASNQSEVIAGREVIEEKVKELEEKFRDAEISRPEHWGGYVVKPLEVEFWQGRPSRLHDRIHYKPASEGHGWIIERLSP